MIPKVVSFDCADTLVKLGWHPFHAMRDCADHCGLEFPDEVYEAYGRLFLAWRSQYEKANLTRNPQALAGFWDDLLLAWLRQIGEPEHHAKALSDSAATLAHGKDSPWFRLFDDVVPCLDRLHNQGIRTCVVSNWDLSLPAVLESQGIAERFELIVASLAEGYEKPDPTLFHIALDRLGVEAHEVVHIGDNPIDDIAGAASAGIPALLVDRTRNVSDRPTRTIHSFLDLPEALTWNA